MFTELASNRFDLNLFYDIFYFISDRKFDVSYNLSKSWTLSDGLNNRDMRRSHDIITNKSREPFYNSFGKKDLEKERKQKAKEESHR